MTKRRGAKKKMDDLERAAESLRKTLRERKGRATAAALDLIWALAVIAACAGLVGRATEKAFPKEPKK